MTATRTGTAKKRAAKRPPAPAVKTEPVDYVFPPVGLARFTEASRLLEQLRDEKARVFVDKIADYTEQRRAATTRPLNHTEALYAANVLAEQMGEDPIGFAEQVQASELRSSDAPGQVEMLLAAGLSTAPEFIDAAMQFVALIELDPDTFRDARKTGTLRVAVSDAAAAITDEDPPLLEMRRRASAAFAHFAAAGGEDPGKLAGLIRDTISGALRLAMEQAKQTDDLSGLSLSTGSPPDTTGDSTS